MFKGIIKGISSKEMCKEFMCEKELQGLKISSLATYYTKIKKHILPLLPNNTRKIKEKDMLQAYLEIMNTVSKNTFVDITILSNSIFKFGYEKKYIPILVKIPYPAKTINNIDVLSDDEQQRLVTYLKNNMSNLNYGLLLAYGTGVRIGELSALRFKYLSQSCVKIRHTLQRVRNMEEEKRTKTKVVISSPKSNGAIRDIPLVEMLSSTYPLIKNPKSDYYLLTGTACYIEPRQIQREFKRLLTCCGIRQITPHVLRHTFATNAVRSGMPLKELAELMGHSDSKITLKYYVYVNYEMKKESMNKLSEELNKTLFS